MAQKSEGKTYFPKHFLWGAATSSHQVEGGNHNNWTVWELENAKSLAKSAEYKLGHLPSWKRIKKLAQDPANYVSGKAIDHYNRYEEDFDMLKKMHLNTFRFSIEWSRIEPEEGVWNAAAIEHYRRYIKVMKARGIEPFITLYHWTVPVWFGEKGGFAKAKNVKYFVRFAEKVLVELGSDLRYVATLNEPDTVAALGYWLQEHPPYRHNIVQAIWAYRNHLKAHKEIFDVGRKISRRFKIGFVKGYAHIEAADRRWTSRCLARADTWLRDGIALRYVGRKTHFLGVNYYMTDYHAGLKLVVGQNSHFTEERLKKPLDIKGRSSVSDLGWSMQPENLEYVLKRLARYKKPIFVTETGVADAQDSYRKQWLQATILAVHNARRAGANVQGYMHWSAFDNFEWSFGRWPCFGLIGIDYDNDLKRVPRKSALYYGSVVKKMRGL